jgi:hypothetical protein
MDFISLQPRVLSVYAANYKKKEIKYRKNSLKKLKRINCIFFLVFTYVNEEPK